MSVRCSFSTSVEPVWTQGHIPGLEAQPICHLWTEPVGFRSTLTGLRAKEGFVGGIKTGKAQMLSMHSVIGQVLVQLSLYRLKTVKPDVVMLGLVSVAMDDDKTDEYYGVKAT